MAIKHLRAWLSPKVLDWITIGTGAQLPICTMALNETADLFSGSTARRHLT